MFFFLYLVWFEICSMLSNTYTKLCSLCTSWAFCLHRRCKVCKPGLKNLCFTMKWVPCARAVKNLPSCLHRRCKVCKPDLKNLCFTMKWVPCARAVKKLPSCLHRRCKVCKPDLKNLCFTMKWVPCARFVKKLPSYSSYTKAFNESLFF